MCDQVRCAWATSTEAERDYHDTEWGVPVQNDRLLFEFLILEGAQAGLSWRTILNKREGYRQAFDQFDPSKIASYSERTVEKLLGNPGIVRNRLKVQAAITNARVFLDAQEEFGAFSDYIWQFVDGCSIQNNWRDASEVPVSTKESDAMSKDLKGRGFKFVGTTICYAYMQATGMVNDHTVDCFRWREIVALSPS